MVIFFPPDYYKSIQQEEETNSQYWKEIMAEFIKQKHNTNTSHQGFSIKMFTRSPLYELFFITLTLQETLVIRTTKKLVATYVVGDLAFLD